MKMKRFYLSWDREALEFGGVVGYELDAYMFHIWIGCLWFTYVRRPS